MARMVEAAMAQVQVQGTPVTLELAVLRKAEGEAGAGREFWTIDTMRKWELDPPRREIRSQTRQSEVT